MDQTVNFSGSNYGGFQVSGSYVQSPVINNHYRKPDTPRPLAKPFINDEPNFPESDFIGRKSILERLFSLFQDDKIQRRAALVGLGGIGKTVLASQFLKEISKIKNLPIWGFWISSTSLVKLEQGLTTMANTIQYPERQTGGEEMIESLSIWLSNPSNGNWIIVLDDYKKGLTDQEGAKMSSIIRRLPKAKHGFILISARDTTSPSELGVVKMAQILTLEPMSPDEAKSVLLKDLENIPDPHLAEELAHALEYIPLALRQAACYIQSKRRCFSIKKYLQLFRGNKSEAKKLLQFESRDGHRDLGDSAVSTTLYLSFREIDEDKSSFAIDLLCFMSFLDSDAIPFSLLEEFYKRLQQCPRDNRNGQFQSLDDGLEQLEDQNLISRDECQENSSFRILRLVQLSVNAWIEKEPRDLDFPDLCIDTLVASWPLVEDSGSQKKKHQLLPHIYAALNCQPSRAQKKQWGTVLRSAGKYADDTEQYCFMDNLAQMSMRIHEDILGRDDPLTLDTALWYLRTLAGSGLNKEVVRLGEDIQERLKNQFGEAHPDTLRCQSCLGDSYGRLGELTKAKKLLTEAHETGLSVLDEDDEVLLDLKDSLGALYNDLGNHSEALDLYDRVHEIRMKKHVPHHVDVLRSKAAIASTYLRMGNDKKGGGLTEEILQVRRDYHGEDRVMTANSKQSLADIYIRRQEHLAYAKQLLDEANCIFKKEYGELHMSTIKSLQSLCLIYNLTSKGSMSRAIYRELREAMEKSDSIGPREKIVILSGSADQMYNEGEYEKACEVEEELVEFSRNQFGDDHRETQVLKGNLAMTYRKLGRLKDSHSLLLPSPSEERNIDLVSVEETSHELSNQF